MFITDKFEPLTHRDCARLKRNHWIPLGIGGVRLHWDFDTGEWLLTAKHGTQSKRLAKETSLADLNETWRAWVVLNRHLRFNP